MPSPPEFTNKKPLKIPISVLVLVYTPDAQVLLLERADIPGFWQSVTGSLEADEVEQLDGKRLTAQRELLEETGIHAPLDHLIDWRIENRFLIYPQFRHRYPDGTTHNTEHVFAFKVDAPVKVTLAPREHLQHVWLPWREAAEKVRSWSNRDVIERLPHYIEHAANDKTA
jgi:dihydroneopterin triphosphate diphosphatase